MVNLMNLKLTLLTLLSLASANLDTTFASALPETAHLETLAAPTLSETVHLNTTTAFALPETTYPKTTTAFVLPEGTSLNTTTASTLPETANVNTTAVSTHSETVHLITTAALTPSGTFIGKIVEDNIRVWSAIKYGTAERFKSPVLFNATNATASAWNANTADQFVCYQPKWCGNGGNCSAPNNSEDCLRLKITAPPTPTNGQLYPVMIWIHGGSFETGDGYTYEAVSFAKKGVVVVSINYRLGFLGYLAGAGGSGLDGNYGFQDQRLAMKWVQMNIKAFGGNSSSVTLAGFSAGAMSIGAHLVSPGSQGLFRSVIMDSNNLGIVLNDRTAAYQQSMKIFNYIVGRKTNITSCQYYYTLMKCVQQVHPQILLDAAAALNEGKMTVSPLVDYFGDIPYQPYAAISSGRYPTNIPIMTGFNRDDGVVFVDPYTGPLNNITSYRAYLKVVFGNSIAAGYSFLDKLYPFPTNTSGFDGRILVSQMITDVVWACPLIKMMSSVTPLRPRTSNYVYTLVHPYSSLMRFFTFTPYCSGKVCHGYELPLIFNNFHNEFTEYDPTEDELILATNINNAWTNFVKFMDPNKGLPLTNMTFAPFNAMIPNITHIDILDKSTNTLFDHSPQCKFWNFINPYPK